MTREEFAGYRHDAVPDYADELARNLQLSAAGARAKAEQVYADLLPDGFDTAGHHFRVIEDGDGTRVGHLWIALREQPDGPEAFGYDFHVEPQLRDRGIGRRAMELARDEARSLGATRLALSVSGDNARAQHLYRSFGFRVTSVQMTMPL